MTFLGTVHPSVANHLWEDGGKSHDLKARGDSGFLSSAEEKAVVVRHGALSRHSTAGQGVRSAVARVGMSGFVSVGDHPPWGLPLGLFVGCGGDAASASDDAASAPSHPA